MSDASETKVFVTIISFWVLLSMFTYMFSDYLEGNSLGGDIKCLKPTGDFSKQMSCNINYEDNSLFGIISNAVNGLLNLTAQVPLINIFVPLARIIIFQFNSGIHALALMLLDGLIIISGYVVWVMARG